MVYKVTKWQHTGYIIYRMHRQHGYTGSPTLSSAMASTSFILVLFLLSFRRGSQTGLNIATWSRLALNSHLPVSLYLPSSEITNMATMPGSSLSLILNASIWPQTAIAEFRSTGFFLGPNFFSSPTLLSSSLLPFLPLPVHTMDCEISNTNGGFTRKDSESRTALGM